jgi:hypothetical protein
MNVRTAVPALAQNGADARLGAFSRSAIVEKQRFIPSVFSSRHFQEAACH